MRRSNMFLGLRIRCLRARSSRRIGGRGEANESGRGFRSRPRGVGATVAAALAGITLLGCGSAGGAGSNGSPAVVAPAKTAKLSGQTLTVYTQAPYGTQLKQYQQYYTYIATQFHKETGSTVKWVYSSSAVSLSQALEQAATTNSGPDVWSIGSSFNGTASALHEFYTIPAKDWAQFGGQSSFVPKMLTMSGPNNSQDIGIPFESIPFVLAYNKALFAKAGIKAAPATWTQFVNDAESVQKANPGVNGAGFSPADPYGPWKPVWSYMEQSGGDFLNHAGNKSTLTSPQLQAALKFYFGLEDQYHVIPKSELTWEASQETSAFLAGKTGMMMDAAYALAQEAQGTPVAKDVAFAPMPDVPYGASARPAGGQIAETIVSGNYYDIAKYYSNTALALKFIQVSTTPAAQLEQFKVMGWMPVTQAGVSEVEKAFPETKPFIVSENNSTPTDYTAAWSDIETGVLAVIGHISQQLASGQPYSSSYVQSQLQSENSIVQSHLSGS
jgi:multiple sugar transport system substrate-binding protein